MTWKVLKLIRYINFILKIKKKLVSNPDRVLHWMRVLLSETVKNPANIIQISKKYYSEFRKPWNSRKWNLNSPNGVDENENFFTDDYQRNLKVKNYKIILAFIKKIKKYCDQHPDKPLVMQNSISRPTLLSNSIYYGPTHFSDALYKMKVPTIHLYYSNNIEMEIPEDQSPPLLRIGDISALNNISAIAEIKISNPKIFIAGFPNLASLQMIGILKTFGWKIVYELLDDWEAFFYLGINKWYRRSFEKAIAFQSDKIMAVSPPLIRKMKRFGIPEEKLTILNNAVPRQFIENAITLFERNILSPLKSRIAGYWGQLNPTFFDWEAVIFAAKQLPEWEFQMIGPNAIENKDLPKNIKILGKIPHNRLLEFCVDWELALIPFKNGMLERAVDPIKIYEYLAVGLRVVTLHMEQTESYPLTVSYESRQELADTILYASKMSISDQDRYELKIFLEKSTWEKRVIKLCHELNINLTWSFS
jgi:hypothetical protein